jgi:hypothetical protein
LQQEDALVALLFPDVLQDFEHQGVVDIVCHAPLSCTKLLGASSPGQMASALESIK